MNNFTGIGNIVRDIELRKTKTGTSYANITLAINGFAGGEKTVDYINCTAWGKVAETLANYCSKGQQIGIEGNLKNNSYTDKNGNKINTTNVNIFKIHFTQGGKQKKEDKGTYVDNFNAGSDLTVDLTSADLPF